MTTFWKPEPKRPKNDPFMWFILIPCLISALGWFVQGAFSFSFSDIKVIPENIQSWLVVAGSTLIIFGAEVNTPFVFVMAFIKIVDIETENHKAWDITALASSLAGTAINMMVNFSLRNRAFFVDMPLGQFWINSMLAIGPILAGIAIALDYYGACVELSRIYQSFKHRYALWLKEKQEWDNGQLEQQTIGELGEIIKEFQQTILQLRQDVSSMGQDITNLQNDVTYLYYPVATLKDFRSIVPQINRQYRQDNPIEKIKAICIDHNFRFDGTERTAERWLSELETIR